ncbi:MAG: outer membrane beta-barrel protein [Endomicrobiaceae bacterium]|nr:outer membrane beta-barrel protein [Endomicrobiaceae bacterium]
MKKIISTLLITCFVAVSVYAEKPFKFIVSEDVSYDDNIYLTKEDKKSSIISSTQLFAEYLNSIPNSGLKFGANANVGYNAYSEAPAKNDYMNAALGFNLSNNKFFLEDNILYTADPATSELTERAKRINNIAAFRFKTSLEKRFSIGFSVSDILDKYIDDDYSDLNRNRINFGAQLYYNLSPKTSFYLGYVFSRLNYQETNIKKDSIGNSLSLGVNGTITQKIKGTAQVSYDTRCYDNELENADRNVGLLGYLLSLTYEPTNKNSIEISGERKMEESTFANNRYYISTEIAAKYKQQICKKWTAGILVAYENMGYPETVNDINRTDNLLKVRPSIDYKFKDNLLAGVWYQLRNKTSNYDSDNVEYMDNKVGAQIKFCF